MRTFKKVPIINNTRPNKGQRKSNQSNHYTAARKHPENVIMPKSLPKQLDCAVMSGLGLAGGAAQGIPTFVCVRAHTYTFCNFGHLQSWMGYVANFVEHYSRRLGPGFRPVFASFGRLKCQKH